MRRSTRVAGVGLLAAALVVPIGVGPATASVRGKAPKRVSHIAVVGRTSTTFTLSWKNPPATHFAAVVIRAAKGSKAPRSARAGAAVARVSKRYHAVTAGRLAAGTEYSFALFATDGHGHYSSRATASGWTGPAPVAALHGSAADTSVGLSWHNPGTHGFASVVVRYAAGRTAPRTATAGTGVHLSRSTATSASVTHLAPGRSYAFSVWAADGAHRYSTVATTLVTTRPLPGAVSQVTATAASATSVRLAWKNPSSADFAGVAVRRADGDTAPASPSAETAVASTSRSTTLVTDHDVVAGSTYSYALFAHDASGHYAAAAHVTVTVPDGGAISGTVTGVGGVVVPGVTVWLVPSDAPAQQVRTDAKGQYSFVGVLAGDYSVCFDGHAAFTGSATGYRPECYGGDFDWIPGGDGPGAATPVTVDAGVTRTGVDEALTPGAGLAGTVTGDLDPQGLGGVTVAVFDAGANEIQDVTTGAGGSYQVTGLADSAAYLVCFDPSGAPGASLTGYLGECYSDDPWDVHSGGPSENAASVPVSAGEFRRGVDANLAAAGAVSGRVTAAAGGAAVAGVQVTLFDGNGAPVDTALSGPDGRYVLKDLSGGTYHVCFDASAVTGGGTGYVDQCYLGIVDYPEYDPTQSTPISVTAGRTSTGVDASLATAGAVSGTVSADGAPLAGTTVDVFDAAGNSLASVTTGAGGAYSVTGLAPATGDQVCFLGDGGDAQYAPECWHDVAWDGMSTVTGATAVAVTAGTPRHVDVDLADPTHIAGQVTGEDASAVFDAEVEVFDGSGQLVGSAPTDPTGAYDVGGLNPLSPGYTVCIDATSAIDGDGTRYLSQCYSGVAWDTDVNPLPAGTTPVTAASTTPTRVDAVLAPKTG